MWDDHACMPLRADDADFLPQLSRCKTSGIDVVCLNVGFDAEPWENTPRMLAHFRHWLRQHSDKYILVERISDIERARSEDKLAVMFDIEGGCSLGDQISMVEFYYDLGVRWMLFAYNLNNALGGGCQDDELGLTPFGQRVLREMERVGMVACCSHTGYRTTMDIMEQASNPVIFSHSNPSGVWEHPRNIPDDAIKACAATGGVIALNGVGPFLTGQERLVNAMVRHIDYVVQLVGPDHVGLGLDYIFDQQELEHYLSLHPNLFPPDRYREGIEMVQPEQIPEIAEMLLDLGYAEVDLKKILGGNHLRVAENVWK